MFDEGCKYVHNLIIPGENEVRYHPNPTPAPQIRLNGGYPNLTAEHNMKIMVNSNTFVSRRFVDFNAGGM